MNVKIKMPDFGTTSSEITVLRWLVNLGARIERGQPLMEIETDKATMQVESIVTGVVKEFLVDCDQSVQVGQVIVIVETEAPEPKVSSVASPPAATPAVAADERPKTSSPPAFKPRPSGGTLFSRNRVRKPADGSDSETAPS